MKKKLPGLFSACMFLFVICYPKVCFEAARSGLLLWYGTLVPTLLPAMMLSRFLLDSGLAYPILKTLLGPLCRLLSLSPYGAYALAVGFVCGCPMGAKTLCDLREQGKISEEEAVYLAGFCNNISPAFLTNFLVFQHLGDGRLLAPTLLILLGAPFLYGLFSNRRYRKNAGQRAAGPNKNQAPATAVSFAVVDACISDSIFSITKLGGYMVLFSVLGSVIDRIPLPNPLFAALLNGITEISVGIHKVCAVPLAFPARYLLLVALTAFGGLCCAAQSSGMLARMGMALADYLKARLAIAAIALLLALPYVLRAAAPSILPLLPL